MLAFALSVDSSLDYARPESRIRKDNSSTTHVWRGFARLLRVLSLRMISFGSISETKNVLCRVNSLSAALMMCDDVAPSTVGVW
jgi:hypothetical protein